MMGDTSQGLGEAQALLLQRAIRCLRAGSEVALHLGRLAQIPAAALSALLSGRQQTLNLKEVRWPEGTGVMLPVNIAISCFCGYLPDTGYAQGNMRDLG